MADLAERLGLAVIKFPEDVALYEKPRDALELLGGDPKQQWRRLLEHFAAFPAPPRFERPCNVQELETVACKFGSHVNGHYQIGHDIKEIRHALIGWGATADKLLQHMPPEVNEAADEADDDADHNHALVPAGTVIDGVDCTGMVDDPKKNGVPVYLQTQNRPALMVPVEVTEAADDAVHHHDHDPQNVEDVPESPAHSTDDDAGAADITVVQSLAEPDVIKYGEVAPSEAVFNEAVTEIKDILARQDRDQDRDWRRIGELAISVGKKYGKDRIGKLAKAVGLKASTLWRYRKVFELATAIEDKLALGRVLNYSAVRELENHPDPEREFRLKPEMTKADAVKIMKAFRKKAKKDKGWEREAIEKQLDGLAALRSGTRLELKTVVKDAAAHYRLIKESVAKLKGAKRKALSPAELRASGDAVRDACYRSAYFLEQLDELIAAAEIAAAAANQEDAALEAARRAFAQQRIKVAQELKQSADRKTDHVASGEGVAL